MAGTEGNLGSEGIIWQPSSHVFDEIHLGHERSQEQRHRIKYFNAETLPMPYKCCSKVPHYRPRPYANMAPGLQAVFVEPDRKSGGTGVFLPRRTTAKELQPTKKPVPMYAAALKPARIVQTLNVNVPELGIQPSPRADIKDKQKIGIQITKKKKDDDKDGSTEVWGMSENLSPSPETYLPKEWTY